MHDEGGELLARRDGRWIRVVSAAKGNGEQDMPVSKLRFSFMHSVRLLRSVVGLNLRTAVFSVMAVFVFRADAQSATNSANPLTFVCIGWPSPYLPTRAPLSAVESEPDLQVPALQDCQSYRPSGNDTRRVAVQPTTSFDLAERVRANGGQWVIVRFATDRKSAPMTIKAAQLLRVVVRAGSKEIRRTYPEGLIGEDTMGIPLKDFEGTPNGTTVTVEVSFAEEARRAPSTSYFTLINHVVPYGVARTGTYMWIPVGLFATNFEADENGIPLSAFPVGLAGGVRLYPSDSSVYFGISGMVNWAIYSSKSQGEGEDSSFNLRSLAVGGVVDVNNMIYLGGAYILDFRRGHDNPGGVFVVGAGPGLLQFLQAAK